MLKLTTTLLVITKENKMLLAKKLRGFGAGKFNGVGGKVEAGESVEQAMLRETFEEINIVPTEYKMLGKIDFEEYVKGEKNKVTMYLFRATDYSGELKTSEEMQPFWFDFDQIPYQNMFEDAKFWMPFLLENEPFYGDFVYDKDFNLLQYNITKQKITPQ